MRPPVQASDPGDLRRRLDGLPGLPIRPATARALLDALGRGEATDPATALDLGFALARLRGQADPVETLAEARWWAAEQGQAAEDLWRHAVAARSALRRATEQKDVDVCSDVALLHQLGPWALAAVEPRALAAWRAIGSAEVRRAWEQRHLGGPMTGLGRDLAERWACDHRLIDAAWLHADEGLDACARDPEVLARVRRARAWAERTPWALALPPTAPDPRARTLVAEVQLAAGRLAEPDATDREEALSRSHAKLYLKHARMIEVEKSQYESISTSNTRWRGDPASPAPGPRLARPTLAEVVAERDRLLGQLDRAVEAQRRAVEGRDADIRRAKLAALAEFAAGAGHELNNPLAVIQGRAQLLLARAEPDAARDLRAIVAQVQRSSRFLRDLMYVARPPSNRPRMCSPSQILKSCFRDLRDEAEARGVRLDLRLPGPDEPILADADALRHAAEVLARNALDASPRGGLVQLTASIDESIGALRWTVADDGLGLAPRDAEHLMDPFYSGRQAGRGLGMGLPRAARGLALAGGGLSWRSAPGRGSTFAIDLPIGPACPVERQGLPAA